MIVIPIQTSEQTFDLICVFEKENIDRMMAYDPMICELAQMPPPYNALRCRMIRCLFGSDEEVKQLAACVDKTSIVNVLQNLERGWKFRPEQGDSDTPFQNIKDQ